MPCISFAVCVVPQCLVNRCICWSMKVSSARRSTSNCVASGSVTLRFTKSALRSKTYLSSFRLNMRQNNRGLRDEGWHPERSEGPHKMTKTFYVYMMTNRSRVVLYTGITNSLVRRVWEHQNGDIEGFTKKYRVNRLVYYENLDDPRHAISREKEIKGWRRAKKNALVETKNPKWADLSPMLFQHMRDPSPAKAGSGSRQKTVCHAEKREGPHR